MGLFSDVGRKVEKTKQAFTDGERAEYVCVACEEPLDENYEYCPRCGEDSVEPAA
ncbi:hypothetical protein [Haloarcula nitratireducens]|uniref:Zinc-ribbon domain-containing protein n=1 Tax=Haloarcula nitratireducens TaxID=2487749 RepID=A0AAW4PC74_9EURY|nr:hypothetical protein [Halomicroarcula nitratireducens]MBX0295418.1 hypothetical protein [Halomicroarcula nitratireducens]